ncbi:hypothetical protein MASR2M39_30890 [Ignavibacteriales bacterium]
MLQLFLSIVALMCNYQWSVELWHSQPFDPLIKDGKIYARGATDDKGQLYMHVKAVQSIMQTVGELPLDKIIIEGRGVGSQVLNHSSLPIKNY